MRAGLSDEDSLQIVQLTVKGLILQHDIFIFPVLHLPLIAHLIIFVPETSYLVPVLIHHLATLLPLMHVSPNEACVTFAHLSRRPKKLRVALLHWT